MARSSRDVYERGVFLALSKVLDLAFAPVAWALALAVLTAWFAARSSARRAWLSGALAVLALYVPSTALCTDALLEKVQQFDGRRASAQTRYDAVLLLGGFASRGPFDDPEVSEAADRLLRAFELVRSGRASRIVVLAGAMEPLPPEADLIAAQLERMGIAEHQLVLGRTSRNTRENALEAKSLVAKAKLQKLVLVTSAFHMQRALECFYAVGLSPDALATDHRGATYTNWFEALAPRAAMLAQTEMALRELAGRWVYRLRGYAKSSP